MQIAECWLVRIVKKGRVLREKAAGKAIFVCLGETQM